MNISEGRLDHLEERSRTLTIAQHRIEMLGVVLQRIADSGIETSIAWAWIGGIAKQILQTVPDQGKDDG